MKRQKGFIWLICLGLISACGSVPEHTTETMTSTAVTGAASRR